MSLQNESHSDFRQPDFDAPRVNRIERDRDVEAILAELTADLPEAALSKLVRLTYTDEMNGNAGVGVRSCQIRSEPIGSSGIEFRHPLPFEPGGIPGIQAFAERVANAAERVAHAAEDLGGIATQTREEAEAMMEGTLGGISPMRFHAFGFSPLKTPEDLMFTLDVVMLGHDLRMNVARITDRMLEGLSSRLSRLVSIHMERTKVLAQVIVAGGVGWIDETAMRIIELAGAQQANVIARLRTDEDVRFSFGGEDGHSYACSMFWEDGTIRGCVDSASGTFRLHADVLRIDPTRLPGTTVAAMVGQSLRKVVDLDLIPHNALIVGMTEAGKVLDLKLEIGRSLVVGNPDDVTDRT